MRHGLISLVIVAGAAAQSNHVPSDFASLIPSSALSLIPSNVLPTSAASPASDASNHGSSATASGEKGSNAATAAGSQTTAPPFVPPPFSTNPGAWTSIWRSIQSNGFSWPSSAYGPGRGPWGGYGGAPYGPDNHPWESDSWGPSAWQSNSAWRSGPWTRWWGGSACPDGDWPGWTQGPWGTSAPWTTWSGCTASTTATSVVTTTVSGVQTTATQYGVQVAQAAGSGGGLGSASNSHGAAPMKTVAPALAALGGAVAILL